MPVAASVPVTLILCALAASSTYHGYIAMTIDPADPRLEQRNQNGAEDGTKQCWLCDVRVDSLSLHCRYCNKCVYGFDHHCIWLNTCVGKANYNYFYRTMISITTMLALHGAVQLALLVDIFVRDDGSNIRAEDWFNTNATIPIAVVLAVFLLLDLGAFSLMSQLLAFHIKLQRLGLTTYAFIVNENQRRREKIKQDNEIAGQRVLEIEKAREDRRTLYRVQLESAGWVRKTCGLYPFWDPLRSKYDVGGASDEVETSNERNPSADQEILQAASDMESLEAVRAAPTDGKS